MSSDKQNPRSPDQQIATVNELIERMKLPWEVVAIYRDDGISGRYKRKRPGFQRMVNDLKSCTVQADLVLVDTFERLSRGEDNSEIRRKLARAGVLVLTADSQFHDPTTVSGKALTMVESIRATEEGRVKAHNVLRGKKDAIEQGHWPGGPVPFGFRLENVMTVTKGVEEISHRIPVPIPELVWIVELIFQLAADRGWAGGRISQYLNDHPDIPAELKPFLASTISDMLDNELYYGEMVWGKNCTGVVDDVRILQPLSGEEWIRNPEFCSGIISRELWDRAQVLRAARRRKNAKSDAEESDGSVRRAKGVALKYPLSGLIVCAACGRAMTTSASAKYTTVNGEERRYVFYICPGKYSGACDNDCHIPEGWLREVVFQLVRERLGLIPDEDV
jgi:site-specific DNA recombinase